MTIRPDDRPQSIQAWLELFDKPEEAPAPEPVADDADATVIASFVELPEIVPVAPASPGFAHPDEVETPVPEDPSEVHFKLAGQDTNATRKGELVKDEAELVAVVEQKSVEPAAEEPAPAPVESAGAPEPAKPAAANMAAPPARPSSGSSKLVLGLAGGAVALAAVAGGGWYYMQQRGEPASDVVAGEAGPSGAIPSAAPSVNAPANAVLAQAAGSLAADARRGGAPAGAIAILDAATVNLAKLYDGADKLAGAEATARTGQIAGAARSAAAQFAAALSAEADRKVQRLGQDQPWADPRRSNAAASEGPARRNVAFALRQSRAQLAAAAAAVGTSATPELALGAARRALTASRSFDSYYFAAYKTPAGAQAVPTEMAQATPVPAPTPSATPTQAASGRGVSPAKLAQFNAKVSEARGIAQSVIRLAQGAKAPRSNAPEAERNRYLTLDQGKKTAQGYLTYLDTLSRSLAGAKNDQEAERYITQADQTRRYLEVLLSRSTAAR